MKAAGEGLGYQWYFKKSGASSWSLWKGHTQASTTAVANDTWNGMKVRCAVTDRYGAKVYSSAAAITVVSQIIRITSQPRNVSVKANHLASFSVSAEGDRLIYQWYYKKSGASKWSIWREYTAPSISPPANNSWNGMQVRCRITDINDNFIDSRAATITLLPTEEDEFHIIKQPAGVIIARSQCGGRNVAFSVNANGTGMTYQ